MKKVLFNLISLIGIAILALAVNACCCNNEDKPAIPFDSGIEKKIDEILSKLTLEEKVGQMTQLEIAMLAESAQDAISKLATLDEAELANVIKENGLAGTFNAKALKEAPKQQSMMLYYGLYQAISAKQPFVIDQARLDSVITKYKVGSILNAPKTAAQTCKDWNAIIKTIQDKSIKEIGIPCLYGIDQIHGSTYVADGTLFPQGINMAATFNRGFVRRAAEITAYETRAAGIPWTFAPTIDMGRQPAWPRQWEGYGEDCYLASEMAREATLGFQGLDPNNVGKENIAACLKHYFGYGVPFNGLDRTSAIISPQDMREKQFAPFLEAFTNGMALSTMTNSSTVNGMSGVASYLYLTQWLKEELNWDGMIVTDWGDITSLHERDHIASSYKEAIKMTINAGVDMAMVPSNWNFCVLLKELVEEGEVPMSRIDDAVRRVLRLKFRLGLFDTPYTTLEDYPNVACQEFRDLSYEAAVESLVLLKNEKEILPIKKGKKILVAGPNANSMRSLNGGWSYTWQGSNDPKYVDQFNTILEALTNEFGKENVIYRAGVTYKEGGNWQDEDASGIKQCVAAASGVDYIVACIGENSYCETPGNIPNLTISENQSTLVKELAKTGKPIILILNEGRPRVIADLVPLATAIVNTMLPSSYGGDALAKLLSGKENFSGKLPYSYPSCCSGVTTYDYKVCEVRTTIEGTYNYSANTNIQWPFGYGLSYTKYEYSNLTSDKSKFTADDEITFKVTVKNVGNVAGKESVLLYTSDLYASVMPDNKRLRAFEKVELSPGESKEVTLKVKGSDLAFVGADARWRLEKGDFVASVGGLIIPLECTITAVWESPNR